MCNLTAKHYRMLLSLHCTETVCIHLLIVDCGINLDYFTAFVMCRRSFHVTLLGLDLCVVRCTGIPSPEENLISVSTVILTHKTRIFHEHHIFAISVKSRNYIHANFWNCPSP